MYIDIHTHALTHDPRILEVHVLDPRTPLELSLPGSKLYCFGLHPWHVDEVEEDRLFSGLKTCAQSEGFFGLGEIGLDRSKSDNFERQTEIFKKQLEFAQKFRIQRIVVHCVRAYFDVLPELQKLKGKPVIILHDFNANMETVQKFMDSTNAYFSFGAKLFKPETTAAKTFKQIELSRVFLETDDQLDKSIFHIYAQAAKIRGIGEDELKKRIQSNFDEICPELQ